MNEMKKWIDRLYDFIGRYLFPINAVGVPLSIIDLAFYREAIVPDLIILVCCGSLFVNWLFEWLIRLSVKLSERRKLRRKKELEK
ncbi:MAG: hypothetical protein K6F57_03745 [Candidatus Saccharibacteria bacterium]|nr:hypothetical protein [Candidatus Saccharibacteria bacterium]